MNNLKEFLQTASADHTLALEEARSHTTSQGKMISADVMTMLMVQAGLYGSFKDISEDKAHPARDMCLAFMDRLRTQSQFNFQPDHPKGQANIGMVDLMIDSLMVESAPQLQSLKTAVLEEATETVKPFANTTLHDVMIARDACPVKPVTQSGGWVTINTTGDVAAHNPRLMALNERTGERVRVNSFRGVSAAGAYDCQVPREWAVSALFVDDVFGVI